MLFIIIICFFFLFFKRYKYIWENKDFIQFIKLCISHWRCDCQSVGNRTIIIQNRMRENYKYKYDLNLRPLFLLRCYSNFTCICCSTSVYALFFLFQFFLMSYTPSIIAVTKKIWIIKQKTAKKKDFRCETATIV